MELPAKKWSVAVWSLVAAGSVVFSYAFMLAMAAVCGVLPVMLLLSGAHSFVVFLLVAFGFIMAGSILWSLIPRRDEFEAPGPLIDLATQPRLRTEIAAIAGMMGEDLPADVYVTADSNAFVAERGGVLGRGSRRVMGLGLPLLQMLNVSQFRAVLAHEFAHFYSGDTRLGPWVFKARSSMVRVFQNIEKSSAVLDLLRRFAAVAIMYLVIVKILVGFWHVFLRLTQFVSRKQEFRSDELACYAAGSEALIGGLKISNQTAPAVEPFWNGVVWPIVQNGHQPMIADGFARFLGTPKVAEATATHLDKEIKKKDSDPFDTHPPLAARIEKARTLNIAAVELDQRPATCLIDDLGTLELALLHKLVPDLTSKELKPVEWETMGQDVYVPLWRAQVTPFVANLAPYSLAEVPALLQKLTPITAQLKDPPGLLLTQQQRTGRAAGVVEAAFKLALLEHGWTLDARPGYVSFTQGDLRVEPANDFFRLLNKQWTAEQWAKYCGQLGIGSWPLVKVDEG